ncbi:hypothetical protein [Streptomyces diacarni]|uniref:hypothetical protein n=1 Tax=Streptomyces diacarni TaxID=2800381 RepID=UPI001FEAE066|nr:hypothetical protein [Streptomyces diacarni]
MTNSTDPRPARIPGYDGGPLTHQPELLGEPLFWLGHPASCAHHEEAESLLFGADHEAAGAFHLNLWERAEWPAFTVPLAGDHRLHVVHRTLRDDTGVDYLLHRPGWDLATLLARDDGHFMGPGLSWHELVTAADNALPGGSTTDPHARLLLLLPAFGDDEVPDEALGRLTAALRARTGVDAPEPLAAALLEGQGAPGPARWTTTGQGATVNDGEHSFRNPANPFALTADRLARVATALAPPGKTA